MMGAVRSVDVEVGGAALICGLFLVVFRLGSLSRQPFGPQSFEIFVKRPLLFLIFGQSSPFVSGAKCASCFIPGCGGVLFVTHDFTFVVALNAGEGGAFISAEMSRRRFDRSPGAGKLSTSNPVATTDAH
jgi:hypothetical protein